ncbi:FkbM family methyltransferase [Brenneria izadpanahii]|uniref:FkbM family methyltransferase n=1 Tax=Brenneria izadpanahii TaxID=2722756 RepID=A0ABX7UTS8_9GAMM|nr:FkbM family methyltransferase [Brenneria izadpanahii]QTF07992.1 FkbM family methyltransferase [Brenneria izadpanahii]
MKIENYIPHESKLLFCKEFIESKRPKYVFGRNDFAVEINNTLNITGFIDETSTDTIYLGKPVSHSLDALPEDAMVLFVSCMSPLTVSKKLSDKNIDFIDYFFFQKYSGLLLPDIPHWIGFADDYSRNKEKYDRLYCLMSDDLSRETLRRLVTFRLYRDLSQMSIFTNRMEDQYFEDFLRLDEESFVDAGGYDGLNSLIFAERYPDYHTIHLFEPNPDIITLAKRKLHALPRVAFYELGLSYCAQQLNFDSNEGVASASKISDSGNTVIHVDALDNVIKDRVTFIKMDIEGAESDAIAGAKQTILAHHPKLAICVYHKPNDFWYLVEQILSIRADYKLYFRHYTEGTDETVMYFVPD